MVVEFVVRIGCCRWHSKHFEPSLSSYPRHPCLERRKTVKNREQAALNTKAPVGLKVLRSRTERRDFSVLPRFQGWEWDFSVEDLCFFGASRLSQLGHIRRGFCEGRFLTPALAERMHDFLGLVRMV